MVPHLPHHKPELVDELGAPVGARSSASMVVVGDLLEVQKAGGNPAHEEVLPPNKSLLLKSLLKEVGPSGSGGRVASLPCAQAVQDVLGQGGLCPFIKEPCLQVVKGSLPCVVG